MCSDGGVSCCRPPEGSKLTQCWIGQAKLLISLTDHHGRYKQLVFVRWLVDALSTVDNYNYGCNQEQQDASGSNDSGNLGCYKKQEPLVGAKDKHILGSNKKPKGCNERPRQRQSGLQEVSSLINGLAGEDRLHALKVDVKFLPVLKTVSAASGHKSLLTFVVM